jgi:hypothetical protein
MLNYTLNRKHGDTCYPSIIYNNTKKKKIRVTVGISAPFHPRPLNPSLVLRAINLQLSIISMLDLLTNFL